jgi:hypothetical protein
MELKTSVDTVTGETGVMREPSYEPNCAGGKHHKIRTGGTVNCKPYSVEQSRVENYELYG